MRTLYRVAADRSKGPCRGLPRTWPDPPPLSLQAAANSERKSDQGAGDLAGTRLTAHAGARRRTCGRGVGLGNWDPFLTVLSLVSR